MSDLAPEPTPPEPPKLSRASLDALVEYAESQAAFWQWHVDLSRDLRRAPGEQSTRNVEGWTFMAMALAESYDD